MGMPEMTVVASVHAGKGEALGGALCSLSLEEEGETGEGKGWRRREGNPRGRGLGAI